MIYKDRSCNDCIKKSVCYAVGNNTERAQTCNEYLKKESILLTPVKVGQLIYVPYRSGVVVEYIVNELCYNEEGAYLSATITCDEKAYPESFALDKFGSTFFTTQYEAKTYKWRIENV